MRKWLLCLLMMFGAGLARADGDAGWWDYYNPVENPDRPEGNFGGAEELPAPHEADRSARSGGRGNLEIVMTPLSQISSELHTRAGAAGQTLQWWQSFREGWQALNELDEALDANIEDDGDGPQIPSSCADTHRGGHDHESNPQPGETAQACSQCFQRAYAEVNFARLTLERLRTIHSRTINFINHWESFGDSVAPIHGMSGLAWQSSRAEIERSRDSFNKTSLNKYEQLLGTMRSALEAVATCERVHFDNPDWNSRYGFMYLETIKVAYRPAT